MVFVSVTRLRIRSRWFLPAFFWYSLLSMIQAKRSPGNLKAIGLLEAKRTFWTLSAWNDAESMRAFMTSGSHRKAMPKLLNWCDEASVAHWEQESAELPAWPEAHRRMLELGRPSKVNPPSAAHLSREIPPPVIS